MIEMSAEEMGAWLTHPTTTKYFQFLHDFRIQLAESVALTLASGNEVDKAHIDKIACVCAVYNDLENIQVEDIKSFYQPEPEKEGTENDKNTNPANWA